MGRAKEKQNNLTETATSTVRDVTPKIEKIVKKRQSSERNEQKRMK